jgi:hypothetical protein
MLTDITREGGRETERVDRGKRDRYHNVNRYHKRDRERDREGR